MHLVWLKEAFDTLTRLFDRVGFGGNIGKIVGMLFPHCRVIGTQLKADYERQMM